MGQAAKVGGQYTFALFDHSGFVTIRHREGGANESTEMFSHHPLGVVAFGVLG